MPRRRKGSFPSLRHHKATGLARVTLSGQDFYCGPWGAKASLVEYDRLVAEWIARERQPLKSAADNLAVDPPSAQPSDDDKSPVPLTIIELIVKYLEHCQAYYRKHDQPTNEITGIRSAAKVLRLAYGREPAEEFGPLKLQDAQKAMIRLGWCRRHINKQIGRIKRLFKWAVSQELVTPLVFEGLRTVPGLKNGRTAAREAPRVLPVDDTAVNATLEHLPPIVADMVRLQRLTGCRPEEICVIRPCDVDTTEPVWAFRPVSHKTEHQGRERVIFIGPRGQDVLRPYLLRDKASYCFCPAEGERKRRLAQHEARTTPINAGNRPGSNRRLRPERSAGAKYTTGSYRRAIHRACELAFGMPAVLRRGPKDESPEQRQLRQQSAREWRDKHCWSPNRLRHSAATEIRKRFGLEAAQVTLGHAAANITQIYAEADREKAAAVMAQVG